MFFNEVEAVPIGINCLTDELYSEVEVTERLSSSIMRIDELVES